MSYKMLILAVLLATILLLCTAAENHGDHWNYPNVDKEEEFPHWGGLCENGTRQSPINLVTKGSLKGEYPSLELADYRKSFVNVTIVNNGHTIQLGGFSNKMELSGGPLKGTYLVEQVHFHWYSEHTLDEIRYPLEAHVVHRNEKYPNISAAVGQKDGIAVLGVLYHVSSMENNAVNAILENLDAVKTYNHMNEPVKMKNPFVVGDLFPDVSGGYMTYGGSLTTPSCNEGVTWIVLRHTFPVTLGQVEKLQQIEFDQGKKLKYNYRQLQKSNHRPLVVVLGDAHSLETPVPSEHNGAAGGLPWPWSTLSAMLTSSLVLNSLR